jgi:DNA repair protein RecN (Recombination protein N)
MLLEIKIENFALVRDLEIFLQPGFNVLTGESGAGKSLIIEALNFVLGAKIKKDRFFGDETARVQAVFDISSVDIDEINDLRISGIIEDDSGNLTLMRKCNSAGRNMYYINGQSVQFGLFRGLGQALVDIHGQRDNQYLLDSTNQRKLVDNASGESAGKLLTEIAHLHKSCREITERINEIQNTDRERNRRIDWLMFEIQEIKKANLHIGEDEELEKTRNILANAEKITLLSSSIYEYLSGERGVIDQLNSASKELTRWGEYDDDVNEYCSQLDVALESIREISALVRDKGESTEYDPARLDEIIGRIHHIETLKRKYGPEIEEILRYLEESERKLEDMKGSEEKLDELIAHLDAYRKEWWNLSRRLSAVRRNTAKHLEEEIVNELNNLGMKEACFRINITSPEGDCNNPSESKDFSISPNGFDSIEYVMSLNPGSPERPLSLIASGGELSRLMLALKNIFAKFRNFSTLILDEIDTGLGGVTAEIVGEKLKEISRHRQVICITHLPVIAAMADYHYHIRKTIEDGRTSTCLSPITGQERVDEVVRMIAGESAPEGTRRVVEKMLKGKN